MRLFKEVKWDRYIIESNVHNNDVYIFYGWIDREKDNYKDFITLHININGDYNFITSSSKYSIEFARRVGGDEAVANHVDCIRVEDTFKNVDNVIRLKKEEVK